MAWFGFDPHSAAAALDDAFADRKAQATAGVLGATVKTLKEFKNLLLVLRVDADAVITN